MDTKAKELSGMGAIMVHDLLILTNDFLLDKSEPPKCTDDGESLFQKMQSEAERQQRRRVSPAAPEGTAVLPKPTVPPLR